MALAANLGCNPRKLYNVLKDQSFMCKLSGVLGLTIQSASESLGSFRTTAFPSRP